MGKVFSFSGRASRTEFWLLFPVFLVGGYYVFFLIVQKMDWPPLIYDFPIFAKLALAIGLYLIAIVPVMALFARRSHDAGIFWLWPVLAIATLVPALLFAMMLIAPSGGNPWVGNGYIAIALFILVLIDFLLILIVGFL